LSWLPAKPIGPDAWSIAILEGELSGLSEEHRQVIVLSRLNGLKYREIAEVLGIPSGTVRSRLHYALEHLRRGLATRGIEG